jgi:hypothetical protein
MWPLRSYSRFSFVKEWRNSISGRWKLHRKKCDVTIQFLVAGLVVHFARIFHLSLLRSKVIQEFHACEMVKKNFSICGGKYDPKNFFANIETPKDTSLKKSASIEALWCRWPFPFGL